MDKEPQEPQFEDKTGAEPFAEVMRILHARMQETYGQHERAMVSAGGTTEFSPPPAPGAYLIRDYELLDGFDLQTAWLQRPKDKHTPPHGIPRGSMFSNGIFVHRVVPEGEVIPSQDPGFYIVELLVDEGEGSTFFLVDDSGAELFSADPDKRADVLGAVLSEVVGIPLTSNQRTSLSETLADDGGETDSFDAEFMAFAWAEELRKMSPQRFTITN